jgi:ABC-2 type transport system permease protein
MSFSFISIKELSVLAQIEVIMTLLQVVLGLSILISMILGSTLVAAEKEQGTLESLMLAPVSKQQIVLAKTVSILVFWLLISVLSLPYFYVLSMGTTLFSSILFFLFVVGTVLVIGFSGLSLIFSAMFTSSKNSALLSIILFLVSSIPFFLSTTNKKVGFAHAMETISPLSSGMKAMKDLLVNKAGTVTVLTDILPGLGFAAIVVIGLVIAGKKLHFIGGETK